MCSLDNWSASNITWLSGLVSRSLLFIAMLQSQTESVSLFWLFSPLYEETFLAVNWKISQYYSVARQWYWPNACSPLYVDHYLRNFKICKKHWRETDLPKYCSCETFVQGARLIKMRLFFVIYLSRHFNCIFSQKVNFSNAKLCNTFILCSALCVFIEFQNKCSFKCFSCGHCVIISVRIISSTHSCDFISTAQQFQRHSPRVRPQILQKRYQYFYNYTICYYF